MKADRRALAWPVVCRPPARAVAPQHVHQLLAQRSCFCVEAHWVKYALHCRNLAGL